MESALNLKANTTDINTSLATKVDKVTGKELSTNDYTTAEKTKLAAITGTNTGDQTDITGNAATATKLATSKNINGVAFDGSVDITVTANAGTLTGTTLASNVVNSSLTSVGTLTSGTISLTTNIATSGTLKAGAITYPNTDGTNGQVLTSNGAGNASWISPTTVSVGTISSTSNANGATITSGVLNLTPADETNGGIVTNGTQTFAGLKTFNDGINYIKVSSSPTLDQSNISSITGSSLGQSFWQSFTAGISGILSSVEWEIQGQPTSITVKIYNGEGINGTLLGTANGMTSTTRSFVAFDLSSSNIKVIASQKYTIQVTTSLNNFSSNNSSNPYANGRSSNDPNSDFLFKTNVKAFSTDSYLPLSGGALTGNLSTSGTLTAGDVTYPSVHGTSGQVLSTTGSGTLTWTNSTADAGTLTGTTLNSSVTGSSLTSVGTLTSGTISLTTNIVTSGTLTAGDVIYPNTAGTNGQVLTSNGAGNATWLSPTSVSVGTISSTSNANGATITSGVLNLTPADETNGGIITTGTQTFAGLKTFNDGINYIKVSSSSTLDQSNISSNGSAGGTSVWQSFTAGISGILSSVEWEMQGGPSPNPRIAVNIYNGEGTSGTLLGTANGMIPFVGISFVAFDLSSSNIKVMAGQIYTIQATTVLNASSRYNNSNVYTGGRASVTPIVDFGFKTYVKATSTDSYLPLSGGALTGNLSTSGTLTAGDVTYPSVHGTSGQVLSTTGSGTLTWTNSTADAGTLTGTTLNSSVTGSSLTSVGTITSGVWSGTAVAVEKGGTGLTSAGTSGQVLTSTGSGTLTWTTSTADAGTLTGTTLNSSVTGSSLTSVGTLNSATVNGKVIVGASSAASASAVLEANSTTQGFLPPRMSGAQRDAISSKVAGLVVWCSNCGSKGELQVFNGTEWTNIIGGRASLYVGMEYQGGIIAYILQNGDPGFDANIQHGLIAATFDQGSSEWKDIDYTITGATGTAIGTGLSNTNAIIASQGTPSIRYAAGLARAYTGGGYEDWYLPSQDELSKLYLNRVAIGGFAKVYYWSSTEYGNYDAWTQSFDGGTQSLNDKVNTSYVRAIRAF